MTPMDQRLLRPRQRPAAARTLYWLGGVDEAWGTLGNWFVDVGGTQPATSLPGARDTAVVSGYVNNEPPQPPTIANLILSGFANLQVSLTVTGLATFNDDSVYAFTTLTGNAVLNGASSLFAGTIIGNVVLNDTASNCGTVTGTVTVNGTPSPCP